MVVYEFTEIYGQIKGKNTIIYKGKIESEDDYYSLKTYIWSEYRVDNVRIQNIVKLSRDTVAEGV
jgi:hypothetical protein